MENQIQIAKLEFPFVRDGFNHELLERHGLICLVRRSKPAHWHYEVVRLQIEQDKICFSKFYPAHERYPSNEEWGTHGFTYHASHLQMARKRQNALLETRLRVGHGKDSGLANKVS